MMKMLKSMAIRVGAAVVLCSVLSCDSEPPTRPELPKDYPVYIGNFETKWFWKYDVPESVVDSFNLPVSMCSLPVLSADGQSIYVGTWDSLVLKTDIASLSTWVIWQGDRKIWLAVSPDNNLLALCGSDLHIIRTSDFGVVYQDTTYTRAGAFSHDSKRFYAACGDPSKGNLGVLKVNLSDPPESGVKLLEAGAVELMCPSRDETRWYIYFDRGEYQSAFGVYDTRADSLIFLDFIVPGNGDMCMTPDGRYVFYTSPGIGMIEGPPPSTLISVYEASSNCLVAHIDAAGRYGNDTASYDVAATTMVVTPDSRWLIATESGFWGWLVVDVTTLQVVKRESLGMDHRFLGYLLCQTQK